MGRTRSSFWRRVVIDKLTEKEKCALAKRIFDTMESDGVNYYFTLGNPDYASLEALGFNVDKIKNAVKGATFLESIFGELEDMSFDMDDY